MCIRDRVYGVPVEAELGKVGGKEDDLEAEADVYKRQV